MAARKRKEPEINLLPQEDFNDSTTGRILHWLLSTFRYMVIVTELVVIVAFLSRFYFDSKVADLNDEIKQKSDYINAYLPFEKDFKLLQRKLSIVSALTTDDKKLSPFAEQIMTKLPIDVRLNQITIEAAGKVNLQASSLSEQSIQQLVVNLAADTLEDVGITQIDSKANTPYINFALEGYIKDRANNYPKPN